jgi:large subunit ribosomal protein L3
VPVTVIEAGPCTVQALRTEEKDGYNAVQLGYGDTKAARLKKPQRAEINSRKLKPKKFVREIRCSDAPEAKIGEEVTNSIIQKGDFLDITGISKGKGFQGGVKRHGWSGGKATHGSKTHRAPGSIGASATPSRVFKGSAMPGQMGNEKKTVQNLEVIDVDPENGTICVKGAVPGANNGYLVIRYALKKDLAPRVEPEVPAGEEDAENEEIRDQEAVQEKKTQDEPGGENVQADEAGPSGEGNEKEGNEEKK